MGILYSSSGRLCRLLLIIALICVMNLQAGVLKGVVMDGPSQLPAANAILELYAVDSALSLKRSGNSTGDGSFFFDSLPEQRYFLKITGQNYPPQWFSPQGTTAYMQFGFWVGPAMDTMKIMLRPVPIDNTPSSMVTIIVKDSSGALMTSGMVQLQAEGDLFTVAIADLNQGAISFGAVQPGRYAVYIQCPPYQPQYLNPSGNTSMANFFITVAAYDTVRYSTVVNLFPAGNGRFCGKVLTETGVLAADVFVGLFSGNDPAVLCYQGRTNASGIFSFEGINERSYFIKIGAVNFPEQWYSPQRKATTRYPDDPVFPSPASDTLFIALSQSPIDNAPSSVLFVSILDSTGMPLASGVGKVECTDRSHLMTKMLVYDPANKRYTVTGLKAGEYAMRLEFPSYPVQYYSPGGTTEVESFYQQIKDKDTVVLEAKLKTRFGPIDTTASYAFNGLVTALPTNTPLKGVRVSAISANAVPVGNVNVSTFWASIATLTDSSGYYMFRNVPPGEYIVTAIADSQNFVAQCYQNADVLAKAKVVRLDSISRPTLNFQLRPGGIISGSVKSVAGAPIKGVSVNVQETNGQRWYSAATDANGNYKVQGIPAGTWNIQVYHPLYLRIYEGQNIPDLTVVEGKTFNQVTIYMDPGGRIAGTVTAPFSLVDSTISPTQQQGRFIGRLLLYADSALSVETMSYPRHTAGVEFFPDSSDQATGTFISDVCPPGRFRAVFQPSPQNTGSDTIGNGVTVTPWLGWTMVGNDSVLERATLIEIAPFDTVANIALTLRKGHTVTGSIKDSAGAPVNRYSVSAFVKSNGRYFCVGFADQYSTGLFRLPGLVTAQDYFIGAWADGYPNQFWSPETTTVVPHTPYRFDASVFTPIAIGLKRQLSDTGGTTPSGQPVSLVSKFSASGALQELTWNIDNRFAFDTCVLYRKQAGKGPELLARVPVQQGVYSYSSQATGSAGGPTRYVVVGSGAGTVVRSNEAYYDPRNSGIAPDSLWIAARGTRWNIKIEWGPPQSAQNDSISLFRRAAGGPWNLIDRRSSWNTTLEDHKWKNEDSGSLYDYRVELLSSRAASRSVTFPLDAAFFAGLAKPLYVGPYERYQTIQSAIDAAKSSDMIVVRSGTYRENINFKGKALFLESDWQFGKPPVIDGNNGIAITIPWTALESEEDHPHIGGFKIRNATTGIATSIPVNLSQCLFTDVTRGLEIVIDSAAMTGALRADPFVTSEVHADLYQCTFIAGRAGSVVAVANARGTAETPGVASSLSGYERLFIMPVYSLSSSLRISHSLIVNYVTVAGSAVLPLKLNGVTPGAWVSDCNLWHTSVNAETPRVKIENLLLTIDPQCIDTFNYFLPDNSPLRFSASDRQTIGYDGRRFEGGGNDSSQISLSPVKNLSVRQISIRKMALSWSAAPDSEKVVRYHIYRCPGDTSLFYVNQQQQWEPRIPEDSIDALIDTFSVTGTGATDTTLIPGKPYLYVVVAVDSAGREGQVDLPATLPLTGRIVNNFAPLLKVKAGVWYLISPWGVDTVPCTSSNDVAIYQWDDTRAADKLLSNYLVSNFLVPGKGFWFRSERDTALTVDMATLDELSAREPSLSIPVIAGRTGWNLVASPLPFPVVPSWLDTLVAWEWNADSLGYRRAAALEPWKAYWVYTQANRTLPVQSDKPSGTAFAKHMSEAIAWQLQLTLSGTNAWDPDNYAGAMTRKEVALSNGGDVVEPPAGFVGTQLYFIESPEGKSSAAGTLKRFSSLYRVIGDSANRRAEWRVGVSPSARETRIAVHGLGSLPSGYYAFWIDNGRVIDLRKNLEISVPPHEQEVSGYLVVTADKNDIALYTGKFILYPSYPNPFRRSMFLLYVVPYEWQQNGARSDGERRHIRIELFDVRGRKIVTLLDDDVAVGAHRLMWNGTDDAQRPVRSGMYIVRMTGNWSHSTVRIFKVN